MLLQKPKPRYWTAASLARLSVLLDLPLDQYSQDWPWEVADPERIDELLGLYQSGGLDEDERFTLMDMIIQCFEDLGDSLENDSRWQATLAMIESHIDLHAHSVWYWACFDAIDIEDAFWTSPCFREMVERNMVPREALLDDAPTG